MARILVVEDEGLIASSFQRLLVAAGHAVETARDGVEAAGAVRNPPDLVVLDLHMPRMGGVEFHRLMRAAPGLKRVPALIVTALRRDTDGIDFGDDEVLEKPVNPRRFLAAVERALKRTRA